jgi:hypothetical protein
LSLATGAELGCSFVDALAAAGNPISTLAALPLLPPLDDQRFKQRFRTALEAALRALPPQRREEEVALT